MKTTLNNTKKEDIKPAGEVKPDYDFRLAYREELEQPNNKYKWLDIDRSSRWLSMFISKRVVKYTHFTPNQITVASLLASLSGGYFLLLGTYGYMLIGGILSFMRQLLDQIDGEVARVKGPSTDLGKWMDGVTGFVGIEVLIFCLALGINTQLSLTMGILAAMAFPMQYLLVFYYKFEIVKEREKMEIGKKGKFEFIRKMYGSTLFHILLLVGVIINKPLWVQIFFGTVGNMAWMITILIEYKNLRYRERKNFAANEAR